MHLSESKHLGAVGLPTLRSLLTRKAERAVVGPNSPSRISSHALEACKPGDAVSAEGWLVFAGGLLESFGIRGCREEEGAARIARNTDRSLSGN